jgi:hypothetical protein
MIPVQRKEYQGEVPCFVMNPSRAIAERGSWQPQANRSWVGRLRWWIQASCQWSPSGRVGDGGMVRLPAGRASRSSIVSQDPR